MTHQERRRRKEHAKKKKADNRRQAIAKPGALTQAGRIFVKFGGAMRLSEILTQIGRPRAYATVFRWDYPKEKGGTGGIIPGSAWPSIMLAARFEGIFLSSEDLDPRKQLMNDLNLRAFPEVIRKNDKRHYRGKYEDPERADLPIHMKKRNRK
jgi:hypothetical protein